MKITDMPAAARPRERLLAHGVASLTDAELLAILLHTGTTGLSAIELAQSIIDRYGSLARLMSAPAGALEGIKGLGPAKRSQMLAVLELARRSYASALEDQPVFESPQSLKHFLLTQFAGQSNERFIALFLDVGHRLIASETLFQGTLTRTAVYPREVARRALAHNAAGVIFAHNHPDGKASPSLNDKKLTSELKKVLDGLEVKVLDHLIVAGNRCWSFHEHGLC
ncbi:MAG: JAB domain-containing protein [Oxalobacteraceae bacterium]|jgi:DNA repair protein RadC|nr:JAB domain-containing protein [Oxalobacteraceae bacterium]